MPPAQSLLQPILDHPSFDAVIQLLSHGRGEVPPSGSGLYSNPRVSPGGQPAGIVPSVVDAQARTLSAAALGTETPAGYPLACSLSGLTRTAKAMVIAGLAHRIRRPLLVVTSDNESADQISRSAGAFLDWLEPGTANSVLSLPDYDCTPYELRSPHAEIAERRAVALWSAAGGRSRVLVTPLIAALGRFQDRSYYASLALILKVGDEVPLDDLIDHLAAVGYERAEPVESMGSFSVRGGILDVFPPESEWPLRIEFFGDMIDSLREFDPGTQRSRKAAPAASLLPLCEIRTSSKLFESIVQALAARIGVTHHTNGQSWAPEYSGKFPGWEFFVHLAEPRPRTIFSLLENPIVVWDEPQGLLAKGKRVFESWQAAYDELQDMVPPRPRPEEFLLGWAEFERTYRGCSQLELNELEIVGDKESSGAPEAKGGAAPAMTASELLDSLPDEVIADLEADLGLERPARNPKKSKLQGMPAVETSAASSPGYRDASPAADAGANAWAILNEAGGIEPEHREEVFLIESGAPGSGMAANITSRFVLMSRPAPLFQGGVKTWAEEVRTHITNHETVIVALAVGGKAERMHEILLDYGIAFIDATSPPRQGRAKGAPADEPSEGVLHIARGDIERGTIIPEARFALFTDSDIFGGIAWRKPEKQRKTSAARFISDLSDLKVGDYVVHVDHGIGLYNGLRQIEVDGKRHDFMLLTYQDEAKLYVPLERLDLVEKYRSGSVLEDGPRPALDRLGGTAWGRTKARVKKALRDMADELLGLYADRKMSGGVACGPDTPWQKEFEETFEFEETPGQLTAIEAIKRDLESPEPMDRLLCGDVGYGKTEVALRAAFKVVQEGRQVAVLAPTTVLAFQHLNTFRRRMAAFPVRIEMVSRFRSPAEQKRILAETRDGRVDILIGTHRLLSKDAGFHGLGLLIVDEEQRFGVAAKEKLKRFKTNVDVLTLTATPIPRTLHMSLGGLRDLSLIETPPQGRLAIQTTVASFNPGLIQAAILHELERGGQVYFVHNRIESIFSIAAVVNRLVPAARLAVAHGQMGEGELEKVMLKFIQDEYDVLISTAIVENGLDIPRANTIIVNRADRFGLADLYQLRGRVGRSDKRAYAYFLAPAENVLTPLARRRLAALKEFSDLGSGFRLAALDLELRGAGNLLGAAQSGHLNSVGIDLYLKMLEQSVEEARGVSPKPELRVTLKLGLDIKIPESYISDESQRLRMYKRISTIASPEARLELQTEMLDRFGNLPESVSNLLDYALLKSSAEEMLVEAIERKTDEVWLRFHPEAPIQPEDLKSFMQRHRGSSFRPDGTLRIKFPPGRESLISQLRNNLQELRTAN
ncbi:MAG TPA: transcription-repair coupling factor [Terriglobia bacterium]|nr:transcription-repair coupling factor [Terriglobia bacterium]